MQLVYESIFHNTVIRDMSYGDWKIRSKSEQDENALFVYSVHASHIFSAN